MAKKEPQQNERPESTARFALKQQQGLHPQTHHKSTWMITRITGKVLVQSYSLRRKSSQASAAQIVSDATVNHHGPQRIGIKTKIRNNSHHPAERFCKGDGATSVVFSERSIIPSPLSPAHLISYGPLVLPQLPISRLLV